MWEWFSRLTNDIINISSAIIASFVCSFLVSKLVKSDIITKSTAAWIESDGDITCESNDTTCTVTCTSSDGDPSVELASCGNAINVLSSGPVIHCPTTVECTECNINCEVKESCSGSTIYAYDCDILNISVSGKDSKYMSIYAPNTGSLLISIPNIFGKIKNSVIFGSNHTNSITIDCYDGEFKDNAVYAANIDGILSYHSSGICKSKDTIFYCPTVNTCTLEFAANKDINTNNGMEITGTHLMQFTCPALTCDVTLACLDSTVNCIECTGYGSCCYGNCVAPTTNPSIVPSALPTHSPTAPPTIHPSSPPTSPPTLNPTLVPSLEPTHYPTAPPTITPSSLNPTSFPSETTKNPSLESTQNLSLPPTLNLTKYPTVNPSYMPTYNPTVNPSIIPSSGPTNYPSSGPTNYPSSHPMYTTLHPSINPTYTPTISYTSNLTKFPITYEPTSTTMSANSDSDTSHGTHALDDQYIMYISLFGISVGVILCIITFLCIFIFRMYSRRRNSTMKNIDRKVSLQSNVEIEEKINPLFNNMRVNILSAVASESESPAIVRLPPNNTSFISVNTSSIYDTVDKEIKPNGDTQSSNVDGNENNDDINLVLKCDPYVVDAKNVNEGEGEEDINNNQRDAFETPFGNSEDSNVMAEETQGRSDDDDEDGCIITTHGIELDSSDTESSAKNVDL